MAPADGAAALVSEEVVADGRRHLPVIADVLPADDADSRGRPKRTGTRARTLSMRRQSKRELDRLRAMFPETGERLPTSRGECQGHDGPCPMVSCKHHLYLDVNPRNGNVKLNFPGFEVWELPETCALDVADRGGATLEEIAVAMNLSRERVRQLEDLSLERLKALDETVALVDCLDGPTPAPTGDLRARIVNIRHTPDAMPRSYR